MPKAKQGKPNPQFLFDPFQGQGQEPTLLAEDSIIETIQEQPDAEAQFHPDDLSTLSPDQYALDMNHPNPALLPVPQKEFREEVEVIQVEPVTSHKQAVQLCYEPSSDEELLLN